MATGKVHLIGGGPGDPELLTLKAARLLGEADVILYDQLISTAMLNHCKPGAELIYVGKRKGVHPLPQSQINRKLLQCSRMFPVTVRLKGGDPFVFGRGGEEYEYLKKRGVEVSVVPGITAACGSAAELGLPLTHRDYSSQVVFMTGHKRIDGDYSDFADLDIQKQTCVVYMGLTVLEQIMEQICSRPTNRRIPVCIIENATRPERRVFRRPADQINELMQNVKVSSPALVVMGEVVNFLDKVEDMEEAYFSRSLAVTGG